MTIFRGQGWSITLLPDWIGKEEENCTAVYHPNGKGSLNFSCYTKDSDVTKSDLVDIAKGQNYADTVLSDAALGDFLGITFVYEDDGVFWQHWYVAKNNKALFITYNCNLAVLGQERDDVQMMISTLVKN